jgi:hypothetical protein
VREHWLVETWEDMKLTVRESKAGDDSTLFVYRYRDGERTSNNSPANNGVRSVRPAEFFEPYFHARAGKSILDLFVRNGVLPPAILRHRVHPKADEPTNAAATMAPEPLVRLGRSDGAVQYVLGVATLAEAAQQNPGVWISQDSFMIHKIRFANEDELTVTKYAPPEGSLLFPAERTVKFGDRHAVIRLISVKPVTASVATQALNAPSAASASLERLTGPASAFEAAKEFYSRFR